MSFGSSFNELSVETHLEKVASAIGMDGLAFRLKNAWEVFDRTATGQKHVGVAKPIGGTSRDRTEWVAVWPAIGG